MRVLDNQMLVHTSDSYVVRNIESLRNHQKKYSWIGPPVATHKKLICQQTERIATIPRPPTKISRQGESKSAWYIFVKFIFSLFFKITFQIIPKQK